MLAALRAKDTVVIRKAGEINLLMVGTTVQCCWLVTCLTSFEQFSDMCKQSMLPGGTLLYGIDQNACCKKSVLFGYR